MKLVLRWVPSFLLLITFGAAAGFAQSVNSGDIRGTVTDPSGAIIPGTTVSVLHLDGERCTTRMGVWRTRSAKSNSTRNTKM
jgi:hypothetical protein